MAKVVFELTADEIQDCAMKKLGRTLAPEELESLSKILSNYLRNQIPICLQVGQDMNEIGGQMYPAKRSSDVG